MKPKHTVIFLGALIALVTAVYVMFSIDGNKETGKQLALAEDGKDRCETAVETGRLLDPKAVGDVAGFRGVEEPLDLSEISFVDAEGNAKTLADWQGKLVLFNLWATWCPPCLEEMPWFEELQVEKGDENFQVVPVSIDTGDIDKPRRFYEENNLDALPLLHDGSMEAFQFLKRKAVALGMPTTLLVDPSGCALGVLNGPAHWASPDARRLIDEALLAVSG